MSRFRLGIDIGGTNTTFGIVDASGKIVAKSSISTRGHNSPETFVAALFEEYKKAFDRTLQDGVTHIGVGAPNGNYYTGNIEFAPNLEWKGVIRLAELIEAQFQRPTKVSNDANAAAMGEMMYGAAQGMKDFIMVTLGTGVGSGFVANGQVIYGHDGFAGELGHVIAVRDGRQCGCGRKGCLETYTSATGIVKTVYEFLTKDSRATPLREKQDITAKDIYDAACLGDAMALEIFDYTGKILGQTLADAVAITSPEAIILFGGLAQAGDYIMNPTRNYMEENLLHIFKNKVKLIPSLLKESDVAILGAAALD
ncbi:MAG: ROK family protein [Chitinophagaceae bacterium]|nr:ROK family protein [Chitinophagaceae bacterium]